MNQFTPCEIIYELEQEENDDSTESGSSDPSGDSVTLEQAEFEGTTLSFRDWLNEQGLGMSLATVGDYWEMKNSVCAKDGHIDITIYAYPSRPDLEYRMEASYGKLTRGAGETSATVRRVNIAYETSYTIAGSLDGPVSVSWDGPVYAEGGRMLANPPAPSVSGNEVTWGGQALKGILVLSYGLARDVWILTLFPREEGAYDGDNNEDAYASTVTAFWGTTGYQDLDVQVPDLDSYCQTGSGLTVNDDDDEERCWRKVLLMDPCNDTEPLDEWREQIECPDDGSSGEEG